MRWLGYVHAGTASDKEICQTVSKIHRKEYDLFNLWGNISKRANEYKTAMVNLKVTLNQSCDILKQPSNKRSRAGILSVTRKSLRNVVKGYITCCIFWDCRT